MRHFKIEKYYKGGSATYCARMRSGLRMRRGCWSYQLEDWGKATTGGHAYGYRIYLKQVRRRPREARAELKFNPDYLEKWKCPKKKSTGSPTTRPS